MSHFYTIFGTFMATSIIAIAGIIAFIYSGIYDVSAISPDSGLVYWAANETMENSVASHAQFIL